MQKQTKPITIRLNRRTQKVLDQIIDEDETYEQFVNNIILSLGVREEINELFWAEIPENDIEPLKRILKAKPTKEYSLRELRQIYKQFKSQRRA